MQVKYPYIEFSGALQQITTPHIRKTNEVQSAVNANFSKVIGAFVRRPGSQKYDATAYPTLPPAPIDKNTLGAFIARYASGPELWMASNVSGDLTSTLRRWSGSSWIDVQTGLLPNAEVNFEYDLDEVWVSSYVKSTDTIGTPFTVDQTHNVSQTRQLGFAPAARFYKEFAGDMWAANVQIGATRYRDRLYKSSGPTGVIAFSRSAQTDVAAAVTLLDNVPTMTSATTPLGVAAASTEVNAANMAYMAFDDNSTLDGSGLVNKWTASTTTGWLRYDFGSGNAKAITYYSITGPEVNTTAALTRAAKTWTFEGSNDASSWTVLDTQTNVAAWALLEKRVYSVSNTTAYRYYRLNITANQGASDYVTIVELELLTSTTGIKALTLNLDSARYIKPTQSIDIYTAGTNTKLFNFTVLAVDKINDSITFLPYQLNFAPGAVNTGTDILTVSDASQFTTGRTIRFTTTSGLPAGLTAGVTYYSIYVTATTIKVATSLTNAQLGVAVDITTTGSGTHTILLSYVIGNKDELWGAGRKGLLTRYWNTDYRNPEDADWLKLPATLDATNDITAVGTLAARMFIWTENSMSKYDGQNLTPLYNDVGCISMNTVCYYQSFMVWLDAKGQVWARNEEAGTQDIISGAIEPTISLINQSLLSGATGVCVGKKYKLTLGQLSLADGTTYTLRIIYDFEANTWATEWFAAQMPVQLEYKYLGSIKPHFFDGHGNFWVDELGDDDGGDVIPLDVQIGDDNLQNDEIKHFIGVKVYGRNCAATKILASVDYGEWHDVGEMVKNIDAIAFPQRGTDKVPDGTMINIRFVNSSTGDPVQIQKAVIYYNPEQDTFRAAK